MHTSIMVPLDGSQEGNSAVPVAAALAQQSGARLELVHVHAPLVHPSGAPMFARRGDDVAPSERRAWLEATAAGLRESSGLTVAATFLTGPVVATLDAHVAARAPDLIVMTTHGLGGPARFLLGSVADALLRRTGLPVLLVRGPTPPTTGHTVSRRSVFRHVLIPLDGSERAEGVIPHAVALADPDATEFTLVSVVVPLVIAPDPLPVLTPAAPRPAGPPWRGPLDVIARHEQEASAYLEQIAAELQACGMTVTTRVVVHAQAAEAILDAAAECHADVIAIATHGRHPLSRWVIGSVADQLVRGTDVPVLVFRQQPAPAPGSEHDRSRDAATPTDAPPIDTGSTRAVSERTPITA